MPTNARGDSEFISEVKAKALEESPIQSQSPSLKFNDVDAVMDNNNKEEFVNAPKSLDRLEEISKLRNEQRKIDEEDDDDEILKISDQDVELGNLDVHIIGQPEVKLDNSFLLNDIEILT